MIRALLSALQNALIYLVRLGWLKDLIALVCKVLAECRRGKWLHDHRKGKPMRCPPRCAVIPPDVYKRADPLIYCQRYLMEQGLSVTWNNPDIQLYRNGVPVNSSQLEADTDYDVVARISNNSTDAPAVGLPVEFSYLSFGVGTTSTAIGTDVINLPVKGAPGHPAQAKVTWHTPAVAGHYCLQAYLRWDDDANPDNNLGQENTNVGHFASPAVFKFPVNNNDTIRKLVTMQADEYVIPDRLSCREKEKYKNKYSDVEQPRRLMTVPVPPLESQEDWNFARARHAHGAFPVSHGWQVDIEPRSMTLAPGQQQEVTVTIMHPDKFEGSKSFNINAFYGTDLLGGVTLTVNT